MYIIIYMYVCVYLRVYVNMHMYTCMYSTCTCIHVRVCTVHVHVGSTTHLNRFVVLNAKVFHQSQNLLIEHLRLAVATSAILCRR